MYGTAAKLVFATYTQVYTYLAASAFHERCERHDAAFHVSERAQRIAVSVGCLLERVCVCASTIFPHCTGGELTKNTTLQLKTGLASDCVGRSISTVPVVLKLSSQVKNCQSGFVRKSFLWFVIHQQCKSVCRCSAFLVNRSRAVIVCNHIEQLK